MAPLGAMREGRELPREEGGLTRKLKWPLSVAESVGGAVNRLRGRASPVDPWNLHGVMPAKGTLCTG